MANNGKSNDILSLAMKDFSPDQQKRALEFAMKLGIKPDDEFWLIFIAVGGLQALIFDLQKLVSEAPDQWQELFFSFQGDLCEWGDQNLQIINGLVLKAQNEDALAKSLQQLVVALSNLTQYSQQLTSELNQLAREYHRSSLEANNSYKNLSDQIQQQSDRISQKLSSMNPKSNGNTTGTGWGMFFTLIIGVGLVFCNWRLTEQSMDTNKRVSWILQRVIKAECASGRKPKYSPECKQF
ncbi:hypothetical protein G7B40_030895 [Aetokthonos hydrillicola Thurmond2011]|jgi:uncharacterized phage infection (PIP) family protein YhgE|uniref:Uncharacterized protein n=1 Tax=Aetokthonos hydrillicola Thurmond2011 TaxID=2712845 RepID=A0AAP5IF15_9CYAN|nr:DUF6753 family protein [Aetokthonos hydrillicola]MBO3463393.1 hypothetical protein [Aetokthonos hydrillicola CCALA 1050]MBW4589678.1 hypothetical protein [Aetokthonos hydrillicola CCALA 1050]MDR9898932.1 hypothetical protein [Aetokthonos hydrillicola Thurmond2011]